MFVTARIRSSFWQQQILIYSNRRTKFVCPLVVSALFYVLMMCQMVVAFSSFVHCSYELSHTLSAEAFSRLIMIGSLQFGDVFMAQRPPK